MYICPIFSLFLMWLLHFLLFHCWKLYCHFYLFRALSKKSKTRKFPDPPINEDEDEDVKAERLKVKELMSCQCCEEVIQNFIIFLIALNMQRVVLHSQVLKWTFSKTNQSYKTRFLWKKNHFGLLLNKHYFIISQ